MEYRRIIPNSISGTNLILGVLSIFESVAGNFEWAAIYIILAVAVDACDGRAARALGVAGKFGVEMDSLCDVCSFGVAPAVMMYYYGMTDFGIWGQLIAALFPVWGALRLARFNINADVIHGYFQGMPIPGGACVLAAFVLSGYDVPQSYVAVLTFVIGFKNPDSNPGKVILSTVLFFAFAVVVGYIIYKVFKIVDKKYPHTRRIPIIGLALCLAFAYIAEKYFGIADITGAYVAGIILCSIQDSGYIAEKMDINSYMMFGPVFFASIGLKTNISGVTGEILLFSICFVIVGLVAKIIGCGLMAKMCRFKNHDCLKIGIGMMTRGEVALIVAQKGLSVGLLTDVYFTAVILLIIVSSISTPILLKLLYSKYPGDETKA